MAAITQITLAEDTVSKMTINRSPRGALSLLFLCCNLLLLGCSEPSQNSPATKSNDSRENIYLIIVGDYVVSMDDDGSVYKDAAVAVHEGVIIAIGDAGEIYGKYNADQLLNGDNQIVMPGLINGHSHAAMTLLRGVADDLALMDWLTNFIFPAEVEFVDAEFVRIGTELACWEMIRGGTTTFVDMYYFPDVIADVVESCGMRALVSATVIDQRSPDAENADDSIAKGMAFIDRWQGRNSRVMPIFGQQWNFALEPFYFVAHDGPSPRWGFRVGISLLLPEG
jgi:5-methylthioadenosine/S-adenosylhomocysteine deaminase